MDTHAIVLTGAKTLSLSHAKLTDPVDGQVVVRVDYSAISTGTENLFWSGTMPPFPGMGYPLIPGYEAMGEIVETCGITPYRVGDRVFVPGANCYQDAFGLFGAASRLLVTAHERVLKLDSGTGEIGALYALAATARHALAGVNTGLPDLIIGHGVVGRLLARLTIAAGGPPPTVWEIDETRRDGANGAYPVIHPNDDGNASYSHIYDASGQSDIMDQLIARLSKGGELVLAGFYPNRIGFNFTPAFMKEARVRIAAEWTQADLKATHALVTSGALSLDGLITHRAKAAQAAHAYETAFTDKSCLKMALDWKDVA